MIIWFNPPYSLNVKANVKKCSSNMEIVIFQEHISFIKYLTATNTLKRNYYCLKNIDSMISFNIKQVLQPCNKNYGRNCRKKESCPLGSKSFTPNIIYEAQITKNKNDEEKRKVSRCS